MLVLLTATGARPEAWRLCEFWMSRQTYARPVKWIIVDDGPEPQPVSFSRDGWSLVHIRRTPHWRPGQITQSANLLRGLECVAADDHLAIIEDDDWYHCDWLSVVTKELLTNQLVGEGGAKYYNIRQRSGRQLINAKHASLCSTAMRGRAIAAFRTACECSPKFIDLELWRTFSDRRVFFGCHVVGLKGLPGRAGIGLGHTSQLRGRTDASLELLRSWIGEDSDRVMGLG